MINRRQALELLGSLSAASLLARRADALGSLVNAAASPQQEPTPALAPGAPTSPERLAFIERFNQKSDGLDARFEARTHKSDWTMPYRLFRPTAAGRLPLVLYLHGSGGLGVDNAKQMGLGNVFGTRVWALP